MDVSSPISFARFKSPWRCLCRSFLRSRERWKAKARHLEGVIEHLRKENQQLRESNQSFSRELATLRQEIKNIQDTADRSVPQWPNLPHHTFSAQMISLCCQLSLLIGFRAVPKVLQCVADALDTSWDIPSRDAIRNWSSRNGVAILQEAQPADDWVWMIDHSVQLGNMFVLVVLGIAQSHLPGDRPLRREDMIPLAVLPTTSRDKEEVERQLIQVAQRYGVPVAVLSDGARELHEGVRGLETLGFSGIHLDDVKHKVSNLLKKNLGSDDRFKAFSTKLGQTTASIQQTELDHLLPPRKKEKCRFMSLDRIIDWATMVEHQFAAAGSEIAESQRLEEKLGWLKEFAVDLQAWRECRQLVGRVLRFANEQGVYVGATDLLRTELTEVPSGSELANSLSKEMLSIYRSNEEQLQKLPSPNVRLPCSTEVLESAFGSFKALQRHHNRGTFTSLLATFPALFDHCTPEKIRVRFSRVCNAQLKEWLKTSGLTNSTQSRRSAAYARATAQSPRETVFSTV